MSAYSTTSLANYLFNKGNSSSNSTSQILQNNLSFLTKGKNGKLSLPTLQDFNAASTSGSKLTIAGNLAKAAKVQTTALAQTGITTRITDITSQTQQALSALKSVTDQIETESGETGLKQSASKISTTLTTIKESMQQIYRASKKADSETASSVLSTLQSMDKTAQSIAETAGLKWTSPLTGTSSSSSSSTSSKASASSSTNASTLRLVDFLA